MDASFVYGSDTEVSSALRSFSNGKLLVSNFGLPFRLGIY